MTSKQIVQCIILRISLLGVLNILFGIVLFLISDSLFTLVISVAGVMIICIMGRFWLKYHNDFNES